MIENIFFLSSCDPDRSIMHLIKQNMNSVMIPIQCKLQIENKTTPCNFLGHGTAEYSIVNKMESSFSHNFDNSTNDWFVCLFV